MFPVVVVELFINNNLKRWAFIMKIVMRFVHLSIERYMLNRIDLMSLYGNVLMDKRLENVLLRVSKANY